MNEILLRGCTLKNSKSIIGAVVYTGAESRIQKNSAKTPHKVGALRQLHWEPRVQPAAGRLQVLRMRAGSFDHFLNFQIAFIILLQISMCVFCAVASYVWRQQYGNPRYFLGLTAYTQARCLPDAGACLAWPWQLLADLQPRKLVGCGRLLSCCSCGWQGREGECLRCRATTRTAAPTPSSCSSPSGSCTPTWFPSPSS